MAMLSENSHAAFQLLFDRYKDHIYRVAMLYAKSPATAEEIVQEVFLKVWLNRNHLFLIRSFESWLYTVARNMILNHARRLATEWKVSVRYARQQTSQESTTDYKIRQAQYEELLRKALSKLPPQQATIFRMAKEDKLTYLQIALKLKISPFTVKTHLSRSLHTVKAYLKDHGGLLLLVVASFLC